MGIRFASCFPSLLLGAVCAGSADAAFLQRVVPFGGTRGTTVEVELIGEGLEKLTSVWFDTPDLVWQETREATDKKVRGVVRVTETAALGPHVVHARLKDGRSNSRLFNVLQFPSVREIEPNEPPKAPQTVELRPQVIHGYAEGDIDVDVYAFEARAGERWTFDVRALEYGSHLECDLTLLDDQGAKVAFNDDRDDFLETPFLEHTFTRSGRYRLKLDQYRGPQGVTCSGNCGYMLQISQLPVISAVSPLGAAAGSRARVRLTGTSLEGVREVSLVPIRLAEHYRLTFPYSMPVRMGGDPEASERILGRIERTSRAGVEVSFDIPGSARAGLWRVWAATAAGAVEGINFEIGQLPEFTEKQAAQMRGLGTADVVVNGSLDSDGEEDSYAVEARAGRPIHVWTLAAQLGLPYLDTVLELFDAKGKLVAEHDDLMTGQGTVIGNPDSSLYYVPKQDGDLRLVVRDRIGRGGPAYPYRLHFRNEQPGFQLLSDPEEFTVRRGAEAELTVLLIREPGFEEAVEVGLEGLPAGMTATVGTIRAGTYFGPSDDGDNVIIPHAALKVRVAGEVAAGEYAVRVTGKSPGGRSATGLTTLWIGPRGKRNDIRRPVTATTITVVDP
ncbi:MAG: hypothetical protein FJW40_24855 [Acidobacteria bacterium]|nr:hypothetical protein [Acidobacteriota bacterium]